MGQEHNHTPNPPTNNQSKGALCLTVLDINFVNWIDFPYPKPKSNQNHQNQLVIWRALSLDTSNPRSFAATCMG